MGALQVRDFVRLRGGNRVICSRSNRVKDFTTGTWSVQSPDLAEPQKLDSATEAVTVRGSKQRVEESRKKLCNSVGCPW